MNQQQFKRPESVLVVIYTETGKVLLLERVTPAGFWQSVTGSLHWDEQPLQAAEREVAEETGLQTSGDLIDCHTVNRYAILPAWRDRFAPHVTSNTEHVFRISYPSCPRICIDCREHRGYRWLSKDKAVLGASSHTDREAILRHVPG